MKAKVAAVAAIGLAAFAAGCASDQNAEKVPILGDIPVFGLLFQSRRSPEPAKPQAGAPPKAEDGRGPNESGNL